MSALRARGTVEARTYKPQNKVEEAEYTHMPARKMKEADMLEAALAYSRRGFNLIPLHTPIIERGDSRCSCRKANCQGIGKHPRTMNGLKDATTDEAKIRKWWGQWPDANIGIVTGAESNIVTLDVDPRHGGNESLTDLLARHGELPATLTFITGGGGRHINFEHPGVKVRNVQASARIGAGLDFRGNGGYIVAPPSLHMSGASYRWQGADTPLARMPQWLLAKLKQSAPKIAGNGAEPIPEGSRNSLLFQEGCSQRHSGKSLEQIETKLLEIDSERCRPPLDEGEVRKIAASAASYLSGNQHNGSTASIKKLSQSNRLVAIASGFELFHSMDGKAYATVKVNGHDETLLIDSRQFRQLLSYRFYLSEETTPSSQGLKDALAVLSGRALFTGAEQEVCIRLASHEGAIYLDLCDSQWRIVQVTGDGWSLIESHECPIKFRRTRGMLALPEPKRGGSIEPLWKLINIKEADRVLAASWLISTFRPGKPFPVLVLHGEQGSAKSTAARILRALIDPNVAPLRSEPREARDLAIAANNHWLVVFDNISHVPAWLSDALCRLATGGGFATRELYSNDEEVIFEAMRPVLMNGIEELTNRSDLLDRSIIIFLPNIPGEKRLTETEVRSEFDAIHASSLGALLDAVSAALASYGQVRFDRLPRMADFAQWAASAEVALGFKRGAFMSAYEDNREDANELALEASSVATAVRTLMADRRDWSGTAAELLDLLNEVVTDSVRHQATFPKKPNKLSGEIKRIAPNLRATGLDVNFRREAYRRIITFEKCM